MKTLAILLLAAVLVGCAAQNEALYAARQKTFSQEFLDENVKSGVTTRDDILRLFGKPMQRQKAATVGNALVAAYIPEEMWVYSYKFIRFDTNLRELRTLVVQFKDGKVTNATLTSFSN